MTIILNFCSCIAEFFVANAFFNHFLIPKKKSNLTVFKRTILISIMLTVINCLSIPLLNTFSIFLLLLLLTNSFTGSWVNKVVTAIVFCSILILLEFISGFVLSAITNESLEILIESSFYQVFLVISSKIALFFVVHLIIAGFPMRSSPEIDKRSIWITFTPIWSIVNMYLLMYMSEYLVTSTKYTVLIVVVGIGLVLSEFSVIITYDRSLRRKDLETQLKIAKAREDANEIFFRTQEHNLDDFRRSFHDFKNQLANIQLLSQENDPLSAKIRNELVEKIDVMVSRQAINVNNRVISNIIQKVKLDCLLLNIQFSYTIQYDDMSFMDALDSSSIFDNAFDNAITACSETKLDTERFVSLLISKRDSFVLVKITNSYVGNLVVQEGILKSSKECGAASHGIGYQNIRLTAQKYGGDCTYEYDDITFTLSIRLQNNLK